MVKRIIFITLVNLYSGAFTPDLYPAARPTQLTSPAAPAPTRRITRAAAAAAAARPGYDVGVVEEKSSTKTSRADMDEAEDAPVAEAAPVETGRKRRRTDAKSVRAIAVRPVKVRFFSLDNGNVCEQHFFTKLNGLPNTIITNILTFHLDPQNLATFSECARLSKRFSNYNYMITQTALKQIMHQANRSLTTELFVKASKKYLENLVDRWITINPFAIRNHPLLITWLNAIKQRVLAISRAQLPTDEKEEVDLGATPIVAAAAAPTPTGEAEPEIITVYGDVLFNILQAIYFVEKEIEKQKTDSKTVLDVREKYMGVLGLLVQDENIRKSGFLRTVLTQWVLEGAAKNPNLEVAQLFVREAKEAGILRTVLTERVLRNAASNPTLAVAELFVSEAKEAGILRTVLNQGVLIAAAENPNPKMLALFKRYEAGAAAR